MTRLALFAIGWRVFASFRALWDRALGKTPFPWESCRIITEDRWVYIYDANRKPVARIFGTTNEARALAEFIVSACQEKHDRMKGGK